MFDNVAFLLCVFFVMWCCTPTSMRLLSLSLNVAFLHACQCMARLQEAALHAPHVFTTIPQHEHQCVSLSLSLSLTLTYFFCNVDSSLFLPSSPDDDRVLQGSTGGGCSVLQPSQPLGA